MKTQTLVIKNMTCSSCIQLVENELTRLGVEIISVKLGEAKVVDTKKVGDEKIRNALQKHGFDLIGNQEDQIVENIRLSILELVNNPESVKQELRFTLYLEEKMGRPYKYLSKLFSHRRKISIEKFLILSKIEKAKELIQYGELTFSEIAYSLGYTNPQHLSGQFKKITGHTMTDFREKGAKNRISLNKI